MCVLCVADGLPSIIRGHKFYLGAKPIDCCSALTFLTAEQAPIVLLISDNDKYTRDTKANAKAWQVKLHAEVVVLPALAIFLSEIGQRSQASLHD